MDNPLVSVIMSVYNSEDCIGYSIESILNQSLKNFELIIIDDASTDSSAEVIERYSSIDSRIRFYKNKINMGLAASLNIAMEKSSGSYIARMDADDISIESRLYEQVQFLDIYPNVDLVGTAVKLKDSDDVWIYPKDHIDIVVSMFFLNPIAHPTVMFRSNLLKRVNLKYDPGIRYSQDYELWTRLSDKICFANIQKPLLIYKYDNIHKPQEYSFTQKRIAVTARKVLILRHFPELKYSKVEKYLEMVSSSTFDRDYLFDFYKDFYLSTLKQGFAPQIFKNKILAEFNSHPGSSIPLFNKLRSQLEGVDSCLRLKKIILKPVHYFRRLKVFLLNIKKTEKEKILEGIIKDQREAFYEVLLNLIHDKVNLAAFSSSKSKLKTVVHLNTWDFGGGAAKVVSLLKREIPEVLSPFEHLLLVGKKVTDDNSVFEFSNIHDSIFVKSLSEQKSLIDYFQLSTFRFLSNPLITASSVIHLHNIHGGYFSPFFLPEISHHRPVIWTLHDMQSFTGHCAHSFDCERWEEGCGSCPNLLTYPGVDIDTTARMFKDKEKIYKHSNLTIVCPSKWLLEKVKRSSLRNKRLELIYNGIDTDIFYKKDRIECRLKYGLPLDRKLLLFVAHAGLKNQYKGGSVALEVFKRIKTKLDCSLIIVGNDSGSDENLIDVINFDYIANESDMAELYSAADVFLYPSLADNCPLVVLESMACGTPVITSNIGGLPELVQDGLTGYVLPLDNSELMSSKLVDLLTDSNKYTTMSMESEKRVRENFSLRVMKAKYDELYTDVIDIFKST